MEAKAVFEIDAGKLADEARFDGVFVLRYRDLLQVEALFRSAKSLLRTRSVYHSSDATILDLDRLQEVTIEQDGETITLRTPTQGAVGPIFKAAGVALPKNIRGV